MEITGREDNKELSRVLPYVKEAYEILNSGSFQDYEKKLNVVANKAVDSLSDIIEDGTLAMDPEQLVKATDVLNKARVSIMDAKRKFLETLIKGETMERAMEPPKPNKNGENSVLLDYFERNKMVAQEASINSIFEDIEKSES